MNSKDFKLANKVLSLINKVSLDETLDMSSDSELEPKEPSPLSIFMRSLQTFINEFKRRALQGKKIEPNFLKGEDLIGEVLFIESRADKLRHKRNISRNTAA